MPRPQTLDPLFRSLHSIKGVGDKLSALLTRFFGAPENIQRVLNVDSYHSPVIAGSGLGGTFALTLVKMAGTEGMHFADYLNTEKALSVIMGIFLSVAVAFFFGMVVQWLARLLFTFRYREHLKWSI